MTFSKITKVLLWKTTLCSEIKVKLLKKLLQNFYNCSMVQIFFQKIETVGLIKNTLA